MFVASRCAWLECCCDLDLNQWATHINFPSNIVCGMFAASEVTPATSATHGSTIGRITGMAKEKISVTIDATVLAATDADARAAGLNRSEMIEQALRNEHLRVALQNYTTRTVLALDIDAYAQKVYQANRSAGL